MNILVIKNRTKDLMKSVNMLFQYIFFNGTSTKISKKLILSDSIINYKILFHPIFNANLNLQIISILLLFFMANKIQTLSCSDHMDGENLEVDYHLHCFH